MIKKLIIPGVILVCSLNVLAERPNFNYVEVGTVDLTHEQVEGEFKGFEITASYELEDNFFIVGKYAESNDLELDMGTKSIGIGYHEKVSENSVITIQLDSVGVIFSRPDAGQFDEQGYQFSLGYKYLLSDSLEVEVAVRRINAGEVDPEYGDYRVDIGVVGLHYIVAAGFGVYADYQEEENSKQVSVGLRYQY